MSHPAADPPASAGEPDAGSRAPTRRGSELLLIVFASVLVTIAMVLVEANQQLGLSPQILYYGLAFLALFTVGHVAVRRWAPYADPLILPCVALINGIGLVMIYRIDLTKGPDGTYAPKQVLFATFGLALLILLLALLRDHRVLAKYGYTAGFIGLVALALPGLLPSSLSEVNGAKLWLKLGIVNIQPSEFAKILLMIFFASFLVSKRELFTVAGRRFLGMDFPRARDMMPVLVAWALSVGVVVLEKDLGTSLLFFGIVLVMLYIATERAAWVVIGLALFIVGCVIAAQIFSHVQTRVETWLDPFAHIYGSGRQLAQSLFGMGTGGIGGSGLGGGSPELISFANSDFIVGALGEELGFIGLAALFMVYLLLMMRGVRSALAVRDSFGKLFGGGLAFSLCLQLFVVAGGVTGLIPMTGLTAPFLAYGGSSLVANYILVALLLRISDAARRPQAPSKPKPKQAPIAEAHTELVERPK